MGEWDKCHRNISVELWWRTLLIPALRRQRQVDLYEFKASLVYRASSRTGPKGTQRSPVSEISLSQHSLDMHAWSALTPESLQALISKL